MYAGYFNINTHKNSTSIVQIKEANEHTHTHVHTHTRPFLLCISSIQSAQDILDGKRGGGGGFRNKVSYNN